MDEFVRLSVVFIGGFVMVRRFRLLLLVLVAASSFLVAAPVSADDPVCTITGTDGDDVLFGTADADVICGLGGDDTIDAGDGDDVVFGGTGSDVIHGGPGNDELAGSEGNDEVHGDAGDDWIGGGKGDDVLHGGDGADTVEGKAGADIIYGGPGDDTLAGNEDADEIHGEDGDDWIGGGKGNDALDGGDGADVIEGKTGNDVIFGGPGDDNLAGNEDADEVYGEDGDDILGGGKGPDLVEGGAGDDVLFGKRGDDTLVGGAGIDTADGNQDSDTCAAETTANCETIIDDGDTVAPIVALLSPIDGAVAFGTEAVRASASDNVAVATVEFAIDGLVVESVAAPNSAGEFVAEFDTTPYPDGIVELSARARDTAGNESETVPISLTISNSLTATERLEDDFQDGEITLDEYTEWGLWSLTNATLLDDRYSTAPELADAEDATPEALMLLARWNELAPETQERLAVYNTLHEIDTTAGSTAPASATAQASATYAGTPQCGGLNTQYVSVVYRKVFRCRLDVNDAAGNPAFEIYYTPDDLDDPSWFDSVYANFKDLPGMVDIFGLSWEWAETVDHTNATGPAGIPDVIDTIAESLSDSYDVYTGSAANGGLAYSAQTPIRVAVHNTRGMVIPDPGLLLFQGPLVQIDNNKDLEHLGRHELFHALQYEYLGWNDIAGAAANGGDLLGLLWWMEATANWAAGKVLEPLPPNAGQINTEDVLQLIRLDDFLMEPWSRIDLFQALNPKRQYGAVILAEYLEQHFGADVIKGTWEELLDTNAIDDIGRELVSQGTTWNELLPGFWKSAYLLTGQSTSPWFIDPSANTVWRGILQGRPELEGDPGALEGLLGLGGIQARPRRVTVPLVYDQQESSSATIAGGGAAFFELLPTSLASLDAPATQGRIAIDVHAEQELEVNLVAFETYPDGICDDVTVDLASAIDPATGADEYAGSIILPIDPTCQFATLIAVNANPQADPIDFAWEATYRIGPNLLTNPGFEQGILGWDYFNDSEYPDEPYPCGWAGAGANPLAHRGNALASLDMTESCQEEGPWGFEQEIQLQQGTAYAASVWYRFRYGGEPVGVLQVVGPGGNVIAEQTLPGRATQHEWAPIALEFTAPAGPVKVRVGYSHETGAGDLVHLDDALVVEQTAATP